MQTNEDSCIVQRELLKFSFGIFACSCSLENRRMELVDRRKGHGCLDCTKVEVSSPRGQIAGQLRSARGCMIVERPIRGCQKHFNSELVPSSPVVGEKTKQAQKAELEKRHKHFIHPVLDGAVTLIQPFSEIASSFPRATLAKPIFWQILALVTTQLPPIWGLTLLPF